MNSDAYMLFTGCHRLFIQGVRRAIREHLEEAFGEDWWDKGVGHALQAEQLKNLNSEIAREPSRDRHSLLDVTHFGYIIANHHDEVFPRAFGDSMRTFREFRRLAAVRNEWAHVQELPIVRARQASELMKSILASLNCEEALEVERMSKSFALEPDTGTSEDFPEELEHQDERFDRQTPKVTPWEFWRQLQSYLVLEKSVETPSQESREHTRVIVRVHNTAPSSRDLPTVRFNNIRIRATGGREHAIGHLMPGETRQVEFAFPAKGLMAVEFEVVGNVDSGELFGFARTTSLPEEVIGPLRQEFARRLESIAIREIVQGILEAIGTPDPQMTISDISRLRETLRTQSEQIKEKRNELGQLFGDFHLSRDSTIGSRLREIILALTEFETKLAALDEAISYTDLGLMNEAVSDLKQIQLAVLRVEDAVRTLTADT